MSWTDWQRIEGDGLDFDEILYEKKAHAELEGGVARVTLNKPDKYNVMTLNTVDEMFRAFYDANHDPSIGVIVIAAAGKNFGTGGDVEWEKWGLREAFYNRYPHNRLIRSSRKPVLAQVQGYCIGGHNHMAYCCDFTIASEDAKFGQATIEEDGGWMKVAVRCERGDRLRRGDEALIISYDPAHEVFKVEPLVDRPVGDPATTQDRAAGRRRPARDRDGAT